MLDLAVDATGDLIYRNGDLVLVEDLDELRQAIWLTLSINQGEWFLNGNFGLDYTVFMKKRYSEFEIRNAIESAIYYDPRILSAHVNDITLDKEDRRLYVEGEVTDIHGTEIPIEGYITID